MEMKTLNHNAEKNESHFVKMVLLAKYILNAFFLSNEMAEP
jgi:hypothetical protein